MKQFKTFFILSLLSLLFVTNISANTIAENDTLTFTQVYQDLKASVSGLAEVLKTPVEHVYEVLIKQQVINSWFGTIFIIVMLVLLFLSIRYLKACNNDPDINDLTVPVVLLIIVSIVTFVALIGTGPDILTGFFNPEYGAIKDIVDFIK